MSDFDTEEQLSDAEAKIRKQGQEIERLRAERIDLVRWMLDRIEDGWHGCVTGDCPHEQASDCIDSLLECFDVDMAARAAGGGDGKTTECYWRGDDYLGVPRV